MNLAGGKGGGNSDRQANNEGEGEEEVGAHDEEEELSISFSSHDVELEAQSWRPESASFPQLTVETTLKISLYDLKTYLTISTLLFRIKSRRRGLIGLAALKLPSFDEASFMNPTSSTTQDFHLFVDALSTGPIIWLNSGLGGGKSGRGVFSSSSSGKKPDARISCLLQIVEESSSSSLSATGGVANSNNNTSSSNSPLLGKILVKTRSSSSALITSSSQPPRPPRSPPRCRPPRNTSPISAAKMVDLP